MALDAPALRLALAKTPGSHTDGLDTVHTLLCRREAPAFQRAATATSASGDELLVACTQESRLFLELNEQTEGAASVAERPIRFVNIRESAGWSRDKASATPKMAALLAMAQLPPPDPVATASYRSAGRCLVVGPADVAERAAALLQDRLDVSVLVSATGGALAQVHARSTHTGELTRLSGWLGQFKAEWVNRNPIDLDLCTRCNACVDACPEGAIGLDYQVNLAACRNHRDCVRVCDAAGAIDFQREPLLHEDSFDLVLDLREVPAFGQHQPPQGYFHVPPDMTPYMTPNMSPDMPPNIPQRSRPQGSALTEAVLQLRDLVGEFEKPRFFRYQHKLCAHSRNQTVGCSACIDVCSTSAIRSDASRKGKAKTELAGGVIVEPHLCVGCGACATVCPSGAMTFGYPGPEVQGRSLRTALLAYAHAGGKQAALLLHSQGAGSRALDELGRAARAGAGVQGLPARVVPLPLWHTASVGLDLWLAAIAQGASQVWVLLTGEEAPTYRQALAEQMAVAQAVLSGLGYAGEHLGLLQWRDARDLAALDQALRAAPAQPVSRPGSFAAQADKRATLDMAIDHLATQAPQPADEIALPAAGSPYGSLVVDGAKCTLCLSCVGACPAAALADNPDQPQLKFIEKNCVQCGLCATTCPEDAITLQPRLWLADSGKARKQARVLAEMQPYRCIQCAKPFGTLRAIENMMSKLAGHAAFQGKGARRLQMCMDCRVIDLHTNPDEVRITDL